MVSLRRICPVLKSSTVLHVSLEQRHELLCGFGDVERALDYLKQMIDQTY